MFTHSLEFPHTTPSSYEQLEQEPDFQPEVHLDLRSPESVLTLKDLGYSDTERRQCASQVAVTSPFKVLSAQGAKAVEQVSLALRSTASRGRATRVPTHVAGGVYKSQFLRDLCTSEVVAEFLSDISGTKLIPHSIPSQQLYINFTPDDISQAVDAWHYDGIGFDYVLMVSDPSHLQGGRFEYFVGTKFEFAELFKMQVRDIRGGVVDELPAERVVSVSFPEAGYGVFQQGNMVIHRASRLLEHAERITLVPGYVACDTSYPDPTAMHDLPFYDEPGIYAEVARHSAWLAQSKLQKAIENLSMDDTCEEVHSVLKASIHDVEAALTALKLRQENGPWSR